MNILFCDIEKVYEYDDDMATFNIQRSLGRKYVFINFDGLEMVMRLSHQ